MTPNTRIAVHLTEQEATDLHEGMCDMIDTKLRQIADLGDDPRDADATERDELKSRLQREIDVAVKVLATLEGGAA